jgi:hypothetical protein
MFYRAGKCYNSTENSFEVERPLITNYPMHHWQ